MTWQHRSRHESERFIEVGVAVAAAVREREVAPLLAALELERSAREAAEAERDALQATITDIESKVSDVYCELTYSRFSKPNTAPVYIMETVREIQEKENAEVVKHAEDAEAALREMLAAFTEWDKEQPTAGRGEAARLLHNAGVAAIRALEGKR